MPRNGHTRRSIALRARRLTVPRMSKLIAVLAILIGAATLGVPTSATAQSAPKPIVCPGGVVVFGQHCPAVRTCSDGIVIPSDAGSDFCAAHGGETLKAPNPSDTPTPSSEPASEPVTAKPKCTDGTAIPNATIAKGRSAMTSFCSAHGGIKGAVGGTR